MPERFKREFKPIFGDVASDFSKALPKQPVLLQRVPKRIELDGTHIELKNDSDEAQHIFSVIWSALNSDWYKNSSARSRTHYKKMLKAFISWLNDQVIDIGKRHLVLKDYESWRVNIVKVQPQSTGLGFIITILKNGVNSDHVDNEAVKYVKQLIRNTEISKYAERKQDTLTSFFASMPWLREHLGERDYLKMESPKVLMGSFSIVVATTLLFIIDQRKLARKSLPNPQQFLNQNYLQKRSRDLSFCRNLILELGKFNADFQPANPLTELLLADFVPLERREDLMLRLKMSKNNRLATRAYNSGLNLSIEPIIFSPETWESHSVIEQYLCAWLCAWQAVQPTDIAKLKRNNFTINKNEHGKPITIQCTYYKSRSQREHSPPMLNANQIEAKALIAYLDNLPEHNSELFSHNICNIPNLNYSDTCIPGRIFRLFQSFTLGKLINENLVIHERSSLFLKAYNAIAVHHELPYDKWVARYKKQENDVSVKKYRQTIKNALPTQHFGLNAVKNSSVHARTDKYRDGDLINQNSHTSLTEKISYLTDSNKDWVNQNGRITRLVMKDIESYVYRPNLDAAMHSAYEKILRTRVIDVLADGITEKSLIQINTIGIVDTRNSAVEIPEFDYTDIIVLNSSETVVAMLHYIGETERQSNRLINNALDYFERTVLPNVEWMERLLKGGYLSAEVIKQGQSVYELIKINLPELFTNELHGAVGA